MLFFLLKLSHSLCVKSENANSTRQNDKIKSLKDCQLNFNFNHGLIALSLSIHTYNNLLFIASQNKRIPTAESNALTLKIKSFSSLCY